MPGKQNEQAAGNGVGDAVSAEYLNIPLSEIVCIVGSGLDLSVFSVPIFYHLTYRSVMHLQIVCNLF